MQLLLSCWYSCCSVADAAVAQPLMQLLLSRWCSCCSAADAADVFLSHCIHITFFNTAVMSLKYYYSFFYCGGCISLFCCQVLFCVVTTAASWLCMEHKVMQETYIFNWGRIIVWLKPMTHRSHLQLVTGFRCVTGLTRIRKSTPQKFLICCWVFFFFFFFEKKYAAFLCIVVDIPLCLCLGESSDVINLSCVSYFNRHAQYRLCMITRNCFH